jgi:SAM-dependent methyltransferase
MKQRLSRLARNSHTLNALDFVLYLLDRAKSYQSNRRFARRYPDFALPPASLAFDAFGHTNYEGYLQTGVEHARFIAGTVRKHVTISRLRILEWGCGPGRIIRHLPEMLTDRNPTVTGVDFSAETIAWCRRSLPGLTFERNNLQPPLSFPDGHFDFVYAISVFTHLDQAGWSDWMLELRRVMADGGVLLLTTHGKQYVPKLLPDERELFNGGRPVFRAKIAQGKKRFVSFHPRDFVLASLPPGLRVLSHTDSSDVPDLRQDVWVLAKGSDAPDHGTPSVREVSPRRAGT